MIILISSLSSVTINTILKLIVARKRPLDIALVIEDFYSFPSGHSMISVLFYGSIIYLLNKKQVKHYKIINIIIGTCIVLIGLSRIYLGVHYASDIIAGWAVATILLIAIINIIERKIGIESINYRSK